MADSDKIARDATIAPRTIDSASIFESGSEVVILHNGTPYRLRITRQDKLILTK